MKNATHGEPAPDASLESPATESSDSPVSPATRWPQARAAARRALSGASPTLVLYILLVIGCSMQISGFGNYSNAALIITGSSVVMIASLGQAFAIISAGFDLSIGGVIPLAAVCFATFTNAGMPVGLAICLTLLVGAAVGTLNALSIAVFKLDALIVTLATLGIAQGLAFTVAHGETVQLSPHAGWLGDTATAQLPYFVFLAIGVSLLALFVLRFTIYGRRIYMVGGNAEAASLAGVRVVALQSSVYVISGMLAALAGIVAASELLAANGALGAEIALTSIAAVVLGGVALHGGTGGIPGVVVGVLFLQTVSNALSIQRVPAFYQTIATGAVLLLAVAVGRVRDLAARSD
jgi:ribose/xylose/arabinose/galactoside ABC-type transport system permease subunit